MVALLQLANLDARLLILAVDQRELYALEVDGVGVDGHINLTGIVFALFHEELILGKGNAFERLARSEHSGHVLCGDTVVVCFRSVCAVSA